MAASDLELRDDGGGEHSGDAVGIPLAELATLLHNITALIEEADRRQGDALRELQTRVDSLSRQAGTARSQVPEEYLPAFEKVESGLDQIALRLARAEAVRATQRSARPAGGTADDWSEAWAPGEQHHPTQPASAQPAATIEAPGSLVEPQMPPTSRTAAETDRADLAPAALLSAVEPVKSLRGSLRPDSMRGRPLRGDVDTFDIVDSTEPGNIEEPWDATSAEALTRVYESFVGAMPSARANAPAHAPAAPHALLDTSAPPASSVPHAEARPHGPVAPALDFDRDWLENRFAEIAARVEQSLAELRSEVPVADIDSRLDQFESRFGQVLQDMASRNESDSAHNFEAQLGELAQHVEQAQLQLQRLDTIEAQLNTVMEKLSDQRLSEILELSARAPAQVDVDRLAHAAAEQVARRLAQVTPAANASPADARRLDELRELLSSFMTERRQGEEQTVSMLDTMQQAMIRLLDRVDSLEVNLQPAHDEPVAAPAEQPLPQPAPQAPAVQRMTPGNAEPQQAKAPEQDETRPAGPAGEDARQSGRISDVTRDQLIAEARRAMQLAAARREAEAQAEAEAAMAEQKSKGKSKGKTDKARSEGGSSLIGGLTKSNRRIMVGAVTLLLLSSAAVMMLMPRKPTTTMPGNASASKATAPQSSMKASTAPTAAAPVTSDKAKAEAPGRQQGAAPQAAGQGASPPAASAPGIPKEFMPRTVPESGVDSLSHEQQGGQDRGVIQDAGVVAPFPGITIAPSQGTGFESQRPVDRQRSSELLVPGSGQVARATPAAVSAAETPQEPAAGSSSAETGRAMPLELPPLTIGPNSLRQAAAKGDPSAEFEVAARFAEGKGVQQNFQQALRWYQRSAGQGFAASQYRLGTLYERGLGAKADPARARVWYQRAAEQGHVKAMHNLAVMATARDLTKPDYGTAAQWFKEAAERGLADSQYNLAVLHESGLGVPKDIQQAYKWYSVARVGGDKEAGRRLDMLRAKIGAAEIALGEALAASFEAKPVDRLVNDAHVAGEAWKTRTAQKQG